MRRQRGLATVEFAISGLLSMTVLFGCIEVGRMLFVWNTVSEATRRAARLAAICPLNDPAIATEAFTLSSGTNPLKGLKGGTVETTYLTAAGAPAASYATAEFVTVALTGYQHTLWIPLMPATVTVPTFTTTLAVESLGWIPEIEDRQCLES